MERATVGRRVDRKDDSERLPGLFPDLDGPHGSVVAYALRSGVITTFESMTVGDALTKLEFLADGDRFSPLRVEVSGTVVIAGTDLDEWICAHPDYYSYRSYGT